MSKPPIIKKPGHELGETGSAKREEIERIFLNISPLEHVIRRQAEISSMHLYHPPVKRAEAQYKLGEALLELAKSERPLAPEEALKHSQQAVDAVQTAYRILLKDLTARQDKPSSELFAGLNQLLELAHDEANIRRDIEAVETMRDKSIITRNGVRYLPISRAAAMAQASESAVNKWIANRVKFDGRTIETYTSITKNAYISEDSAKKMAQRFVAWPSNKPVGSVVLGETDDQSGFIGLTDAARILHVGHHTIWLWVTQHKAPTAKPLDVIKCTVSDYFYIREKDISELKSAIPRTGLRRGRRPREAAQPS